MSGKHTYTEEGKFAGSRLDAAVAALYPDYSRSFLKTAEIEPSVNGKPAKWSHKLKPGDIVEFEIPEIKHLELVPQDVPFDILYSDDDIAVINKPYGLPVHPSHGHPDKTLVNGLLFRLGDKITGVGGADRPGIVHRLDMDTAGLMVVAMNDHSHRVLSEMFRERKVGKIYHAIVKGHLPGKGRFEHPLGRSHSNPLKRAVIPVADGGKPAITEYKVLEYLDEHAYVEIVLLTGRTHQIRIHFAYEGHPIAGDPLYSRHPKAYGLSGIALCAKELSFTHPSTGKEMSFKIELPGEFSALLERLRKSLP
ncbi:MAG: hypothetical protein A2Y33_15975 [Spirochaetes bacterium GWF1_51_8]|nr:MAG: hypothetical protein A2Y33_15975 [Spirochaetes bacterium GWF1_51_8]